VRDRLKFLTVALAFLTASCGGGGATHTVIPLSGPVRDAPGRLLFGAQGQFKTFTPATKAVTTLPGPEGWFAGQPAASPDGRLIAFATTTRSAEGFYSTGTDLYLMAPDGTGRRRLLEHDASGVSYTEPAWDPGGKMLYYTRVAGGGKVRIERARLDGTGRAIVAEGAHSPTVSARGRLAFLTTNASTVTQSLWVRDANGTRRRAVGEDTFSALSSPRFSPDGEHLAFAAVGGPEGPNPRSELPWHRRHAWRGVESAAGHAVPWDLWIVGTDGTALTRVTFLNENVPVPAWSPDGRWIAFSGEYGLYLLEVAGRRVLRVSPEIANGGMTWVRP
jgi:Tol biopolymer transport system component